jgi:hypothetical protein
MEEKSELTFDVRVVERYIREGLITKEEYEEYLKKLPDVSDKGCPLTIDDKAKEHSEHKLENKEEETK